MGPSAAGVLPLRVRCSEKCSVLAELVAAPALARKLGVAGAKTPVVLGSTSKGLALTRGLSVRPKKASVRRRLVARGRSSLLLVLTVRDGQANPTIIRKAVHI